MKWVLVLALFALAGCNTTGHLSRYDKQPGGLVDESALGVKYPLCLRSDPNSLRLTSERLDDGLRLVIWTRRDLSKSSSNIKPRRENVNVWLTWPTPKNNLFLKFAAGFVFAHKLAQDEQTPNTLWQLSDFASCKKK